MTKQKKQVDRKKNPPAPWLSWVRKIRWDPYFCASLYESWMSSMDAADEAAFLVQASPQFSAWLSGRAYRLSFGPKPFVMEWNEGAPRAAALGLYTRANAATVLQVVDDMLGPEAGRQVRDEVKRRCGMDSSDPVLQSEWETGWEMEHQLHARR